MRMNQQQVDDHHRKMGICPECLGTGQIPRPGKLPSECQECDGTGKHFGLGGQSSGNAHGRNIVDESPDAVAAPRTDCSAEAMPEEHSSITCEADQHAELIKWADGHRIAYRHSPMHEAHKEGDGEPDFLFMANRKVVFVEMKFGRHKKPTKKQQERQDYYHFCGVRGDTFWTIAEAIYFVSEHLIDKLKEQE